MMHPIQIAAFAFAAKATLALTALSASALAESTTTRSTLSAAASAHPLHHGCECSLKFLGIQCLVTVFVVSLNEHGCQTFGVHLTARSTAWATTLASASK